VSCLIWQSYRVLWSSSLNWALVCHCGKSDTFPVSSAIAMRRNHNHNHNCFANGNCSCNGNFPGYTVVVKKFDTPARASRLQPMTFHVECLE
jgi:hypothetical protein